VVAVLVDGGYVSSGPIPDGSCRAGGRGFIQIPPASSKRDDDARSDVPSGWPIAVI
jgi:hypothetical protein